MRPSVKKKVDKEVHHLKVLAFGCHLINIQQVDIYTMGQICAGGRTETDICLRETFKGSKIHFKSYKSDLKRKVRRYRRKIERLESQMKIQLLFVNDQ